MSYIRHDVAESHDHPRPEETWHVKEEEESVAYMKLQRDLIASV